MVDISAAPFQKKTPAIAGVFVLFGPLSLSVSPQKTPGKYTVTTASAGAVFGGFECHVTFLSEIKSGAIWQIKKTLSIMNLVKEKNMVL